MVLFFPLNVMVYIVLGDRKRARVRDNVTYKHNILVPNVKDDEFFMFAKFRFSSIICAEVIANKSFSTGKPVRLRP